MRLWSTVQGRSEEGVRGWCTDGFAAAHASGALALSGGAQFGLGLGGGLRYSAAAIALDANKQVAYCRNHRGKVVGRQLLALCEEEQLFCFEGLPIVVATRT